MQNLIGLAIGKGEALYTCSTIGRHCIGMQLSMKHNF